MRFHLSEDQRALRAACTGAAGAALRRRGPARRRGASGARPCAVAGVGEAGFFALRLPEADGGVGLGLPEAVLVFEEAGRVLLPGPLIATHLAAGTVPGAAAA